ncbi:MAG: hypothetical protein M3270_02835, partial [Thermoproteota archaeon]|nr:hypothetical protein [Thermoproteota archaeon]
LSRISATENYLGGLLGPMLMVAIGTGFSFTAINIAALAGTKKGEEGLASGLINTSRQIGGPIGLAILLTVANVGVSQGSSSGHLMQSAKAVVTGFGYAFLAAAFLTGIGIIFAVSLKEKKQVQPSTTPATKHQS